MNEKIRNVAMVLIGVAGLVAGGRYAGPFEELVRSYGGNLSASFAVYFILKNLKLGGRWGGLWTAAVALAVVDLFEASDGFGVMSNTYDPLDFAANAAGVALAWGVDEFVLRRWKLTSAS